MRRAGAIFLLAVALSACGLGRQRAEREAAFAESRAASQACMARYPDTPKDAIAGAACLNEAEKIVRPYMPFPDLLDLRLAGRQEIAERYAAGRISKAQMNLEGSQLQASLVGEEQRRINSNRSVAAQQTAASAAVAGAAAASAPRTCTRTFDTVTCF